MTIIKMDKVGFSYNGNEVLRDISFDIQPGEFVGLIGPNGSGKTTLLKLIEGILPPREGEILIQGKPVGQMKRRALARIIAVVPQESSTVFPFVVHEVVLMGRTPHLAPWQFEGAKDYDIVNRALAMTDTMHLADRPMDRLSGGERQRVLIARALAQEPRVMLLDEPTAFLDIRHQVVFFNLIKWLNKNERLTVLAVTHDVNLAALYCDRIILLGEGSIRVMGRPVDVVTEEHMQAVYNTPVFVDRHPIVGLPRVTPKQESPQETGSR
jgi:iron complex transport system ATP-binding protein